MGFSAYILETLKRYGKADLGPLGSFVLDYQPANWIIGKENFQPPIAKLSWLASTGLSVDESTVPQVIALLHDIPYPQARDFFKKTIETFQESLADRTIDFGILGTLKKDLDKQQLLFEVNPKFIDSVKQDALRLQPLARKAQENESYNWWLVLASALFLATIFWLIHILTRHDDLNTSNSLMPFVTSTSIKQTNSSPIAVDNRTDSISTQPNRLGPFIIIAGTFCKRVNINRMRNSLKATTFEVYEEALPNNCTRLGVKTYSTPESIEALEQIRKNIEPSAWILDQ